MKKLDNYVERKKSILTDKEELEHLHTFKDFPVFMGCVDSPQSEDIVADMVWNICKDTGVIQLGELMPLEVLYLQQHNDGTGKVWKEHYQEFTEFIHKNSPGDNILEIGGAHDIIASNYMRVNPKVNWTTVEPNPEHIDNEKIKVIKEFFDNKFVFNGNVDTIVHSHVFEHVYHPFEFISNISSFLKVGQKHIFSFPNFMPMLKNNQTNCLNFEHTVFLTEHFTEYILEKCGFKVTDKQYFGNPHSVFYATEKIELPKNIPLPENKHIEYKSLFMGFINYHLEMVRDLNKKIESSTLPIYLFGGHIFSQFLIKFGLSTSKIVCILDNSPIKIGKRLYGTSLMVNSPKVLKNKKGANIILKAATYNEEIKKDILENINKEVTFW